MIVTNPSDPSDLVTSAKWDKDKFHYGARLIATPIDKTLTLPGNTLSYYPSVSDDFASLSATVTIQSTPIT